MSTSKFQALPLLSCYLVDFFSITPHKRTFSTCVACCYQHKNKPCQSSRYMSCKLSATSITLGIYLTYRANQHYSKYMSSSQGPECSAFAKPTQNHL